MRTSRPQAFVAASLILLLALVVSACGNAARNASAPSTPTKPSAGPKTNAEPASAGMDLSQVKVCELLPVAEVEAMIGQLRKDSTRPTTAIDRERGCKYVEAKHGHFYEVTLNPLDQWNLAKVTLKDAQPLPNVGDGAYVGTYSDSIWLDVLVKDRVVIGVRVSDKNRDNALALYHLALEHLP